MKTKTDSPSDQPKRILLVEDDLHIRQVFSEALTLSGFQVDTAEDGAAGWNALTSPNQQGRGYDLLITDNRMPKLSGVELAEKVRSARLALPVILASSELPQNVEWLQLAAVLPKPFFPEQLLQTVKEVLQRAPLQESYYSLQL